jgi:Protein of unknown function (DUF3105)
MAAKGKTPAKSTRPRRGAPPPVVVSRPRPWGLIAATVAMVLFAGGVIGYAVHQVQVKKGETPEALAADAAKIEGIAVVNFPSRNHVQTPVTYSQTPPMGGDHDAEWADCTGTVYPNQIRNENAVHGLEHGAVWITYRPGLSTAELDSLKRRVNGINFMMLSPYPGLKTKVSVQSWGHQLFVDSTDDARIDRFIKDLKVNAATTPEFGASCEDPAFKANPRGPAAAAPTGTPAPSATATPSASGQP